ncbi:MAG: glycoside hydrolase family 97 protein [Agriterribacter sp.]
MKPLKPKLKLFCSLLLCTGSCFFLHATDTLTVKSPSGNILVKIWAGRQLQYSVYHKQKALLSNSVIDMVLQDGDALSKDLRIRSAKQTRTTAQIISPVPEKRKIIPDIYQELAIQFKKSFAVIFRVYDDGVAYRIQTGFKDSIIVKDETALFNFPGNPSAYYPDIEHREDMFNTSFEHNYKFSKIRDIADTSIAYSPILVVPDQNPKIAITESDLEDYPGLFVKGTGKAALRSTFAAYPLEEKSLEALYSTVYVSKRAAYIARTKGARAFPWRIIMIAEEDRQLPSNDIVYRLSSPSRVAETNWIQPGNITDEWIIDVNLFNVPFKAGRNTASYKYYIDFVKQFGIKYIMMDAGWSDNNDLFKVIPEINMDTLVAYAKQQGVKIALWTLARTLNQQLDSALTQFNKWGVDFIMTDFIDRDDQKAVNLHYRIAKACADHKIMIMFHGSYPPKGFNRTYPNAVAREAVLGSEYNMWSERVTPDHDLLIPFIRMLAGSLDYEPGMLNNATKKTFRATGDFVMSYGTRMHQLAMCTVFDSPIQFFAGNPSQGLMEPEYMKILGSIPTIWDETKILDASVGNYIVTARNKSSQWHIGAMTNWEARNLDITLDFLEDGIEYNATICRDGINAEKYPADYAIEKKKVRKGELYTILMAPGGGFYMRIEK